MIKLPLDRLPVNQRLARDLFDESGNLLLAHDTMLEQRHIEQLVKKGYREVYLREETPPVKETAVKKTVFPRRDTLLPGMGTAIEHVKEFMLQVSAGHAITRSQVEETIDLIYPEIVGTTNILRQIRLLREKDEYTLKHSVSVSVIAVKIGETMGIAEGPLRSLGIAALLHDIGKARIPAELINKPTELTPRELQEVRKHPLEGFRIVQDMKIPDTAVVTAILQHHERCDGSGYPFRVLGRKLHVFSRIIAVADVFDALTSDRPYRRAIPLFGALDEVVNNSVGHLDPLISRRLAAYVLNMIPGELVQLNDGSTASVVLVNRDEPHRPVVRAGSQFINLKEERQLHVIDIA